MVLRVECLSPLAQGMRQEEERGSESGRPIAGFEGRGLSQGTHVALEVGKAPADGRGQTGISVLWPQGADSCQCARARARQQGPCPPGVCRKDAAGTPGLEPGRCRSD